VTLLSTLDEHNIDFCVHGEDVTTDENGRDTYEIVKNAGRYRTIKRAEAVSTTDIVGRMILMTKDHLSHHSSSSAIHNVDVKQMDVMRTIPCQGQRNPDTGISHFLPTTRRIVQFALGSKAPSQTDKVVYADGAFDLFHVGHIETLRQAKKMGDYLIVGVHDDHVVNLIKGGNMPIMNLHERVLSVLACRYVNEVVIGAPWQITKELLLNMGIHVVAHGTCVDYPKESTADPYAIPTQMGICRQFQSEYSELTTRHIIERIVQNRLFYIERNRKKERKDKVANPHMKTNDNLVTKMSTMKGSDGKNKKV